MSENLSKLIPFKMGLRCIRTQSTAQGHLWAKPQTIGRDLPLAGPAKEVGHAKTTDDRQTPGDATAGNGRGFKDARTRSSHAGTELRGEVRIALATHPDS